MTGDQFQSRSYAVRREQRGWWQVWGWSQRSQWLLSTSGTTEEQNSTNKSIDRQHLPSRFATRISDELDERHRRTAESYCWDPLNKWRNRSNQHHSFRSVYQLVSEGRPDSFPALNPVGCFDAWSQWPRRKFLDQHRTWSSSSRTWSTSPWSCPNWPGDV